MEITIDITEKLTVNIVSNGELRKCVRTNGFEIISIVEDIESNMQDAMADEWQDEQLKLGKIRVTENDIWYAEREKNSFTDCNGKWFRKGSRFLFLNNGGGHPNKILSYKVDKLTNDFIEMDYVASNEIQIKTLVGIAELKKIRRTRY